MRKKLIFDWLRFGEPTNHTRLRRFEEESIFPNSSTFIMCVSVLFFFIFYAPRWNTKAPKMTAEAAKLRVLCLHGYRQNGQIFREKLGQFRKQFKTIEFHFVDAPHLISDDTAENKDQRSWWFTNENNTFRAIDRTDLCIGFQESVDFVIKKCKEDGPYDGLLAFSQGASFAAILCTAFLEELGIRFVILVAGFRSLTTSHSVYYENVVDIPSLHVMGESDTVISKEKSEELYNCFDKEKATILIHEGGHYVPANKALEEGYSTFFKKFS